MMPTMADPAHKKRVQGGHRASATKMIRKAEELLAKDDLDIAQLAKIRLSLQEKVSVLKQLDSEVVDLVNEDEVADEIEQADSYMEDVYDTMARLEQLSSKNSNPTPPPTPPTHPDPPNRENKVRLPKLTIQPFKGELTAWTTFWDSYETAIDAKIHHCRTLRNLTIFDPCYKDLHWMLSLGSRSLPQITGRLSIH